jgi:hypothetical protein
LDLVQRLPLIFVFIAALGCLHGCDLEVEIDDAAPRVTWFSAHPAANGVIDVTVWVYDLERQPVDLTVTWTLDDTNQGDITHAAGGHGVLGLTTDGTDMGANGRPDPGGQPHLLRWALDSDLAADANLKLVFTPDDRVSLPGPTVYSPTFTPAAGLPTVTAL